MTDAPPPRRHGYWVILDGDTPTSFRARDRETLVPTLTQLRRTQPAVTLKWFDRGRLWESPEAARDALNARRQQRRPSRPADWRPGGAHKDPRKRFELTRDQKRARFKARARRPTGDAPASRAPRGPKRSK